MMNLGLISELPIVEDKFIYELYGINWIPVAISTLELVNLCIV